MSHSVSQGVNGSANSQPENMYFGNAGKLENPSGDRTGQPSCYEILLCRSCVIHHDLNSELTWISTFTLSSRGGRHSGFLCITQKWFYVRG